MYLTDRLISIGKWFKAWVVLFKWLLVRAQWKRQAGRVTG